MASLLNLPRHHQPLPRPSWEKYNDDSTAPKFVRPGSKTVSDACPSTMPTMRTADGSANYHKWTDVSYDNSTGYFHAYLVTNECNANQTFDLRRETACVGQTLPDVNFKEHTPYQMALLGTAAWSINGVNVYSPKENGFEEGLLCEEPAGTVESISPSWFPS